MELALIKKISRESKDYFAITFGLILYALGWAMLRENHLCHLHANLPPLAFPMDTKGRKRKPAPAFRTRAGLYGMCHWSGYVGLWHRYRIL